MNVPAIIALVILIIGFMANLMYPIFKFKKVCKKIAKYKKVKGKVIDFIEHFHLFHFRRRYYPVVKYTVDNKDYEIVSKVGYGLSFFMPKKLTVLYNPQNPSESELTNQRNLILIAIIGFSIAVLLMILFLVEGLFLDNTMKVYEYRVICNYEGYTYDEIEAREAKTKEEALNLIKEKYKNWNMPCEFEEVNVNRG